jgi:mono/diheme cytochrome c family protein
LRPTKRIQRSALLLALCGTVPACFAEPALSALTHAQSAYLESCGGCHGLQGISAKELVPDLRDRAGFWLCTTEGREYIVKLPNVAFAARTDDELAALMNFVVFGLGGPSAPKTAKPYTAAEVRQLRADPQVITDVRVRRRTIAAGLVKICNAPRDMTKAFRGY